MLSELSAFEALTRGVLALAGFVLFVMVLVGLLSLLAGRD